MDIDHIAKLAKLSLRSDEKEVFTRQFADILEQFEILNALEASNSVAHGNGGQDAPMRADTAVSVDPKKQDALLDASRYRDGRFLRMPSVFE